MKIYKGEMIMQIAVCDDCMEDVLSLKKFLEGHEVSVYSDADSLLADIDNKRIQYDLYLLDIYKYPADTSHTVSFYYLCLLKGCLHRSTR